tara:strand:- start:1953 stop:2651 length:699 start_codon:yes stop_codon:yes gene_type:complete
MRKPFNSKSQTSVPEIKPVEEICEEETLVPLIEKINYKQENMFISPEKVEDIPKEVEDTPEEVEPMEPMEPIEPIKRGRGKRGKDKKPRIRKPPSQKMLKHLEKCRELSKQKREAKKLEKIRIKKEIAEKAEYNTSKNRIVNIPKTPPISIKQPIKTKGDDYMKFFNLMDRYEEYKVERNKVKELKTISQPHPSNRVITNRDRPKRPPSTYNNVMKNKPKKIVNPYDSFFKY